jgi:hypothetical protein
MTGGKRIEHLGKRTAPLIEKSDYDEQVTPAPQTGDRTNSQWLIIWNFTVFKSALSQVATDIVLTVMCVDETANVWFGFVGVSVCF